MAQIVASFSVIYFIPLYEVSLEQDIRSITDVIVFTLFSIFFVYFSLQEAILRTLHDSTVSIGCVTDWLFDQTNSVFESKTLVCSPTETYSVCIQEYFLRWNQTSQVWCLVRRKSFWRDHCPGVPMGGGHWKTG